MLSLPRLPVGLANTVIGTKEIGGLEGVQLLFQVLQAVVEGTGTPVHSVQHMAGIEVGILSSCQLPFHPCQPLSCLLNLPPQPLHGVCQVGSGCSSGVAGGHHITYSGQVLLQPSEGALKGASSPGVLQEAGPLCQCSGAGGQILHHTVPVPEAGVAGLAGREGTSKASGTLVTADSRDARPAVTVAAAAVALGTGYTTGVTVAGSALLPRVAPVVLLAVGASPAPKAWPAGALPCELVAGGCQGVLRVAGARLAALPTGQVPEVGAAAVTALALHMGQAVALPAVPVTVTLLWPTGAGVSAQGVAGATPAAVSCGISVEARLALSTVGPCCVVEATQALPCAPVARLWVRHIDVIVALAGQAAPTLQRVPIVPRGTLITAGTCVPRAAVADDLLGAAVLVAGGSEMAGGAGPLRTGAGPAVLPGAQRWVPKVSGRAPLAPFTICVVTAAQAAACPRVAILSMPIALAGPADRETPVARLAAVTAWAMGALTAGALPCGAVADGAH